MTDVRIDITSNGPYKVTGPIELFDAEGRPVSVAEGRSVFLCRCGGSTNKPFCDGTHSRIGFDGAMTAVKQAESEGS